jgi:hypothetical protein
MLFIALVGARLCLAPAILTGFTCFTEAQPLVGARLCLAPSIPTGFTCFTEAQPQRIARPR